MAKKRARKRSTKTRSNFFATSVFTSALLMITVGFGIIQYVLASESPIDVSGEEVDPNFGVKNRVIEFFEANDAEDMLPIIKCESRYRHFHKDGTVLTNSAGSSAIGVAQILSSVHPDPRIIERHNNKFDAGLSVEDFDVTTLEGNLGYALVLYQVNGTKDWECAKKFRW